MVSQMTSKASLDELVRQYQVCWEVWPEQAVIGGMSRQVGFELELLGTDNNMDEFAPTCRKSVAIHAALEAVAAWALEQDELVTCEMSHSDTSLSYSAARGNRPDVTLSIKILHRNGFELPVDESERNYLEKSKARLRQLGASEHRWYPARTSNGGG